MVMGTPIATGMGLPTDVGAAIDLALRTLLREDPRFSPEAVDGFAKAVQTVIAMAAADSTVSYELIAHPNLEVRVEDGLTVDVLVLTPEI